MNPTLIQSKHVFQIFKFWKWKLFFENENRKQEQKIFSQTKCYLNYYLILKIICLVKWKFEPQFGDILHNSLNDHFHSYQFFLGYIQIITSFFGPTIITSQTRADPEWAHLTCVHNTVWKSFVFGLQCPSLSKLRRKRKKARRWRRRRWRQ